MPILDILQHPDPRLRQKARWVTAFDDAKLQQDIDNMLETLINTDNCAGLAATQLDIVDPPFVTVVFDYRLAERPTKDQVLCLVNPKIVSSEGTYFEAEGCMSVSGGIYEAIKRAKTVVVQAQDREGKTFEIVGQDYMAKLLQHEIDHLNGMIFIDRLSQLKRSRIDKKIQKIKKKKD